MGRRIILQDNLWFTDKPAGNYSRPDGSSQIPFEPLLGRTESDDAQAKMQELQWLFRYTGRTGRGLIITQEWVKPYVPGVSPDRIDKNLAGSWRQIFATHGGRARWCIFYDTVLAHHQRGIMSSPPFDFSQPQLLAAWKSDLDHLATYFNDAKYWRIGGKPVLYVFALHAWSHSDAPLAEAEKRGIYILGDVFMRPKRPKHTHGVTGFHLYLPGTSPRPLPYPLVQYLPTLEAELSRWRKEPGFVPAASLQYDDTAFVLDPTHQTQIVAFKAGDVRRLLRLLAGYATPRIMLGTANNWAEGITVLPTERKGPRFRSDRIGNYHFRLLELIREELFAGVREYTGPRLKIRKSSIIASDLDVMARVRVRPAKALLGDNLRKNFTRRFDLKPPCSFYCRNLDGRTARADL